MTAGEQTLLTSHPSPPFTYNQTKTPVTFSCHLLFYMKKDCGL